MEAHKARKLITLTRDVDQINGALKEFNAVPITSDAIFKLLHEIYRVEPWRVSPTLPDDVLRATANSIVAAYLGRERVEANFDVAPSMIIELPQCDEARRELARCRMPPGTLVSGIQDWQRLFGRGIGTGAWPWLELVSGWENADVYEFLLARSMHDALERHTPKGTMMRSADSNVVYRVALRRYEKMASNKFRFHFTASPLDLPFSLNLSNGPDSQTVLYHLVCLSWYFRRRVVDQLYNDVLETLAMARLKNVDVRIRNLYDEIARELMDVDAQSIIRGVNNPRAVEDAFRDIPKAVETLEKLTDWYTQRDQLMERMRAGPESLPEVAETLHHMAMLNVEFSRHAAAAYSLATDGLRAPPAPKRQAGASGTARRVQLVTGS